VATQARGSYWERVKYSLTYRSFASFNEPCNPVRFMYGKRTIFDTVPYNPVHLMVPKIR